MSLQKSWRQLPLALLVLLLGAASSAVAAPAGVGPQLKFGTQMAQRGLWNEALFRFRQAERLEPANARVLNNIAVALEAVGKFEEAQTTYQRAVQVDPRNNEVKKNLARFVEFYQGYKIQPKSAAPASPAPTAPAPPSDTVPPPAPVPPPPTIAPTPEPSEPPPAHPPSSPREGGR